VLERKGSELSLQVTSDSRLGEEEKSRVVVEDYVVVTWDEVVIASYTYDRCLTWAVDV
jgi:hypothetical protein